MNWKFTVAAISAVCFAFGFTAQRAPGATLDPCKLLSAAQISAVLGAEVSAGKPASSSNNKSCRWAALAPLGSSKLRREVALTLLSPSEASMNGAIPAARGGENTPGHKIANLPADGFRADAYYMTMPEIGGVQVPKDRSILKIRVHGFPVDQIKTREKILADCVLETLTNGRFQGECPV